MSEPDAAERAARAFEHFAWRVDPEDDDHWQRVKLALQGLAIALSTASERPSSEQVAAISAIMEDAMAAASSPTTDRP